MDCANTALRSRGVILWLKWRTEIVWNSNLFNMENFKLDLSKLTPVPEAERVKGNWYVVADENEGFIAPAITQYHSDNCGMDIDGDKTWVEWAFWFAIPADLPGFPKAELPDKITLPLKDWSCSYNSDVILLHRKPEMVKTLVLPAGTKEQRRNRLLEELEKLG